MRNIGNYWIEDSYRTSLFLNMIRTLLWLFFFLFPILSFACMPPSPWEVMIGRIDSVTTTQSWVWLDFKKYDFPFRNESYVHPTTWRWMNYSDTKYPNISSGSMIIALSDAQDGSYPDRYSIFHITTITCKDDSLILWKRYGTVMGWNKKKGSGCGYQAKSLLDVFIEWDESVWLKKLEDKYPSCKAFEKHFQQDIGHTGGIDTVYKNNTVQSSTGYWIIDVLIRWFGRIFWLS